MDRLTPDLTDEVGVTTPAVGWRVVEGVGLWGVVGLIMSLEMLRTWFCEEV